MKKIFFALLGFGIFSGLMAEIIASPHVIDGLCNLYSEQARAWYYGDNSSARSYKERIKNYKDRFGLQDFDSSECDINIDYGAAQYDCARYGGCGYYHGRYYNHQNPSYPWGNYNRYRWDYQNPSQPWKSPRRRLNPQDPWK